MVTRKKGSGPPKPPAEPDPPHGLPLIRITVTAEHTARFAPMPELLRRELTYHEAHFHNSPKGTWERSDREIRMFRFGRRHSVVIPAGYVPRCRASLEAAGYTVTVDDERRPGRRLQYKRDVLLDAGAEELELLEAVVREPLGQIEAGSFGERVARITTLAGLYPQAQVVVAVPTRRDAWLYWEALGGAMGHRVGLHHGTRFRKGSRCLVTTFIHLPFVRAEGHILVIPEPARSLGNVALDAAVRTPFERRYALVPPGFRPTGWRSVLRLEAMAGRPLVEQARAGRAGGGGPPRSEGRSAAGPAPEAEAHLGQPGTQRRRRKSGPRRGEEVRPRSHPGGVGRARPHPGETPPHLAPAAPVVAGRRCRRM